MTNGLQFRLEPGTYRARSSTVNYSLTAFGENIKETEWKCHRIRRERWTIEHRHRKRSVTCFLSFRSWYRCKRRWWCSWINISSV